MEALGSGFGVLGSGFRVWRFRVLGSGFGVQGFGFRVQGFGGLRIGWRARSGESGVEVQGYKASAY